MKKEAKNKDDAPRIRKRTERQTRYHRMMAKPYAVFYTQRGGDVVEESFDTLKQARARVRQLVKKGRKYATPESAGKVTCITTMPKMGIDFAYENAHDDLLMEWAKEEAHRRALLDCGVDEDELTDQLRHRYTENEDSEVRAAFESWLARKGR